MQTNENPLLTFFKIHVFSRFNNETGKLTFTGDVNDVPSPNFVCVFQPHRNGRTSHVAKL
ncbi:unnamed protein product [Ectocarpus sp. CCAP 1310/34]|nr:unnamed protein product [Ectocarpus sp. CCAP 1310/34]